MLVYLGLELELRSDVMTEDILQVGLFSHALRSEVQDVSHLFRCVRCILFRFIAFCSVSLRFVPFRCVPFRFTAFCSVPLRFVPFRFVPLHLNMVGLSWAGLVGQLIIQSVGRDNCGICNCMQEQLFTKRNKHSQHTKWYNAFAVRRLMALACDPI